VDARVALGAGLFRRLGSGHQRLVLGTILVLEEMLELGSQGST
jgi:hypothetical protein